MIVAKLERNTDFSISPSAYRPFIFVGYTRYWTIADDWGTHIDDVIEEGGQLTDVQTIKIDFLNDLIRQTSLNDCIAQEGSFYFDVTNQLVYIHINHDKSPLLDEVNYGYAFGFSKQSVLNINGFPYLPLIKSVPDASREARVAGKSVTQSTASVVLNNREIENPVTRKPEGVLDFLLTENIYQNIFDIFDYDEDTGSMVQLSSWKIGAPTISTEEVRLELQDRRYK